MGPQKSKPLFLLLGCSKTVLGWPQMANFGQNSTKTDFCTCSKLGFNVKYLKIMKMSIRMWSKW